MIFGVDGVLLLDSAVPECKGFTGMALFVFVTLGFDSRAIMSNPDCLESFVGQIINGTLFVTGLSMVIHTVLKKQNQGNSNVIANHDPRRHHKNWCC